MQSCADIAGEIPGHRCSTVLNTDAGYSSSARYIISKFSSPSDPLTHDFSLFFLLEEKCSLSCVLPLCNPETEALGGWERSSADRLLI